MPAGASQPKVTYADLEDMVRYVQSRHAALRSVAALGRGVLDMAQPLPLQGKAYLALISFLRDCSKQQGKGSSQAAPDQGFLGKIMASCLIVSTPQCCRLMSYLVRTECLKC